MKIAFFVSEFPVLSETFVIQQIAGMVKAGHDVTVITSRLVNNSVEHDLYLKYRLSEKVYRIRKESGNRISRLFLFLQFAISASFSPSGFRKWKALLSALLSGCNPAALDIAWQTKAGSIGAFDAIVAHFGPAGVGAMYLQQAGLLEGPIATAFHGFDISHHSILAQYKKNYQRLFKQARLLLPISELWARRLELLGAPKEKIRVLRMGVDLGRLVMLHSNVRVSEPMHVLSVARFIEKKGIEYAIQGVQQANCGIKYDIIGSGSLEKRLRTIAERPSSNTISFLGRQPQEKVFLALATADIFLLPSVTAASGDMEGVPVALMEAMAKGILVIATKHSGIPELVEDGVSGFLVDERDAEQIARVLEKIALGCYDINLIRRNARKAVEAKFDNAVLHKELEHICRLLKNKAHVSDGISVE